MNLAAKSVLPLDVIAAIVEIMVSASLIRRGSASAQSALARRQRVSIDLRALGPVLRTIAQSRHISTAGLVRLVLADWLDARTEPAMRGACLAEAPPFPGADTRETVKVTLRMPARHAARLAHAARASESSQGSYVAGLIDGMPPLPVPRDQRENRSVLAQSTATLAALSGDLHAFMRMLRQSGPLGIDACNDKVDALSDAILKHLAATAPLVAAQMPSRRRTEGGLVQRP